MKKQNGITLTALVITIIILLILAGITINLTIGERGIITRAQQAKMEMKLAETKDTMKLDILSAETEAIIRGEQLEKAQLNDIIAKYGELQEDGDTIITHEDKFQISLKEIWYGVLSESGSYTDKLAQIEILEKELADLKKKYEELEQLNQGNAQIVEDLRNQITSLENDKQNLQQKITVLEQKIATLESEKNEYANYRKIITTAITEVGIQTSESEVANKVAQNIKNILIEATKDATATSADIAQGKIAYAKGQKLIGTGKNTSAKITKINFSSHKRESERVCKFDISSLYSNYKNITAENIIVDKLYHSYSQYVSSSGNTLISIEYDANTGIITSTGEWWSSTEKNNACNIYIIESEMNEIYR